MDNQGHQHCGLNVGLSFLLGGLVGAGAALLLAPKSGKETREQIKGMAKDIKEKAESAFKGEGEKNES